MRLMRVVGALAVGIVALMAAGIAPQSVFAADVVVDGSIYACTQAGIADAINDAATTDPIEPGIVRFDCDDNTIEFSSPISVGDTSAQSVLLYGDNNGNQIVFDGGESTRFFSVAANGMLTLERITMTNGSSDDDGGAIKVDGGDLTVISTIVTNNVANNHGGAIYAAANGSVTIHGSDFTNNHVGGGSDDSHGGAIYSTGQLNIHNSNFTDNSAGGGTGDSYGGAIASTNVLVIEGSTFDGNSAGGGTGAAYGGAIHTTSATYIGQSTFTDNSVGGGAGESYGGAMYASAGILTLTAAQNSFIGNRAGGGGGVGHGGAIATSTTSLQSVATTFSGNTAGQGSTVYAVGAGAVTAIYWSTIVQTTSTPALYTDSLFSLRGTLVSGVDGHSEHCQLIDLGVVSDSFSLEDGNTCQLDGAGSAQNVTDLGLGPLTTTNLHGVVQSYYPLVQGSPAIDAGLSSCDTGFIPYTDPEPDQLGTPRPVGPACDIGAIETLVSSTLCTRYGALRMVDKGADCARGETQIQLPNDAPLTLCVNKWNGSASAGGPCSRSEYSVTVYGTGSVAVCVNRWNGALRVSDRCSRSEVAGAI